jgi:hypothetical protein
VYECMCVCVFACVRVFVRFMQFNKPRVFLQLQALQAPARRNKRLQPPIGPLSFTYSGYMCYEFGINDQMSRAT